MAETTKKNDGLGLQKTEGNFQLRGIITGTEKDKFYTEMTTKTGKPMRMVNFGVEIDKGKTIYVNLNGMEKETVCFSKKEGEGKNKKTVTEKVKWANRFDFKKDGFKPIGVNVGLEKVVDSTGKEINDKKTLFEYDACKYIGDTAKDGMSVFIKGKNEFSTYNDKHQTKFIPNQVSLCKDVDFEADDFKVVGNFEQTIVFMGIDKNEDGNFTINAKIVAFNSIEDAEFIIDKSDVKLAKTLKTLKPYNAVKVYGNIVVEHDIDEVEDEDDGWGAKNPMERINNPTKRTLVVIGAYKDSVDTDTYSEEIIDKAIAKSKASKTADKDFGSNDEDWGTVSDKDITDDDDEWD